MNHDPSSKSPDPVSAARKPRRRFFWRAILFLMFPVVVFLCWFLPNLHRARVQYEVVQYLESRGWEVMYDFRAGLRSPSGPRWAREMLGGDFFDRVAYVYASDKRKVDSLHDDLQKIAELPEIWSLDLSKTGVTDDDLKILHKFKGLRILRVSQCPVTDAGLAHLRPLSKLERLDLSYTKVTDAGLLGLESYEYLKCLDLAGTAVTVDGLINIKRLNLASLYVKDTNLDENDLRHLLGMKSLEYVDIRDGRKTFVPPSMDAESEVRLDAPQTSNQPDGASRRTLQGAEP